MRAAATRDTTPTGAVIAASLLVTGLLAAHPVVGQEPREERAGSVTPEQFDRWMTELSNWSRWGPDDELGTLNLVTGAKRVEAAALVRTGRTVSLSRDPVVGSEVTFLVTSGILMDMPGAGHVRTEDIEAWERRTGITISSGDALFLRTAGSGGYHNSIMQFIRERDIALLLADGGVVDGGPIEGRTTLPMHMFTLVALGMPLIDGPDLEALADVAAELNRWEFMFVLAPLTVPNGAGAAINPIAVF